MYRVVEKKLTGGETGPRIYVPNQSPKDNQVFVAETADEEEAKNLCSLTPEIKYLIQAIFEFLDQGEGKNLGQELKKAEMTIKDNRKRRIQHGLTNTSPYTYNLDYKWEEERFKLINFLTSVSDQFGDIDDIELKIIIIQRWFENRKIKKMWN